MRFYSKVERQVLAVVMCLKLTICRLPSIRAEITDDQAFKEFYYFLFDYGKPSTQKILGMRILKFFFFHVRNLPCRFGDCNRALENGAQR